jgi:pimeloyl-ACP methyl ester carboxylesterase
VQLLLIGFPDRLLSATVFATAVLEGATGSPQPLADIDPRLLALWEHLADARDRDEEIAFRVQHWRILNGDEVSFDADEFRRLEERIIDHTGRHDNPAAHARADLGGLTRGSELATVTVPTLVIEAPADPINPPPTASQIVAAIPTARLVKIPGMGHALGSSILDPLAEAILRHSAQVAATYTSARRSSPRTTGLCGVSTE